MRYGSDRAKNFAFLSAISIGPIAIALVAFTYAISASDAAKPATDSHAFVYHQTWTKKLDANADSTPIVDDNVLIKKVRRTVVIVLAGNNDSDCDPGNPVSRATTYAFNATTGKIFWSRSTSGPGRCTTASPAVWSNWVFSPGLDGKIHRYAVTTGREYKKHGWPKPFTRQADVEKSSSNLVVSANHLYLATSGFIGDAGHYEGHVVTIDLKSGAETVWNSLCSNLHKLISSNSNSSAYCPDVQAGMFGRGQAAVDPINDDVYVVTGNGPWNGKTDWGDSVLKLNPGGNKLLDSFTPTNQQYLNNSDSDLGSTGPALIPPVTSDGEIYHLLVQGGKGPATSSDGPRVLWLVNRGQMSGKSGPGHLGGQLQHIRAPGGCEVLTAPAIWIDGQGRPVVIYGNDCGMAAYNVVTSPTASPKLVVRWSISDPSTTPVVSRGVLFSARGGTLEAYNPSNGEPIWKSTNSGSGGTIGGIHWEYPAIANNWIFIADEDARLHAYKLG